MAATIENAGEVSFTNTKNEITTTTTEIVAEESLDYSYVRPVEVKIPTVFQTREFNCSYPTVDPNVVRVTEPLPFPVKLKELIAWTDAFVDRIASQTREEEKKNTYIIEHWKGELVKVSKQLRESEERVKKARDETKEVEKKNAKLTQDLNKANNDLEAQKKLTAQAIKETGKERSRADKLQELLEQAREHDHDDEETIKHLRALLAYVESERKKAVDALIAKKQELANAKLTIAQQKALIGKLDKQVEDLKVDIRKKKSTIFDLTASLKNVEKKKAELEEALKSEQAAGAKARKELKDALAKIAEKEKVIIAANDKIKGLENDNKTLTTEKNNEITAKNQALADLKTEQERATLLGKDIEKAEADLSAKVRKVQELEASESSLKANLNQEIAAREKAEKDLEHERKTQGDENNRKVNPLKDEVKTLTEKNEALSKLVVPFHDPSKRINILTVEYGGKAFTYANNKSVFEKLYTHAQKRTSFDISNAFFEEDPKVGVIKTTSITYQLSGDGTPHHLVGTEYTKASFK